LAKLFVESNLKALGINHLQENEGFLEIDELDAQENEGFLVLLKESP
jgi:hypothetical protein